MTTPRRGRRVGGRRKDRKGAGDQTVVTHAFDGAVSLIKVGLLVVQTIHVRPVSEESSVRIRGGVIVRFRYLFEQSSGLACAYTLVVFRSAWHGSQGPGDDVSIHGNTDRAGNLRRTGLLAQSRHQVTLRVTSALEARAVTPPQSSAGSWPSRARAAGAWRRSVQSAPRWCRRSWRG